MSESRRTPVQRKRKPSISSDFSDEESKDGGQPRKVSRQHKKRISEAPPTTSPVKQKGKGVVLNNTDSESTRDGGLVHKEVPTQHNKLLPHSDDERAQTTDVSDDDNEEEEEEEEEDYNKESTPADQVPGTPQESPAKKRKVFKITQSEKDALIENLKIEVAERARRLRARYKTQAQYLKDQISWRIDHIPPRLRNVTIGELLAQHSNKGSTHWDKTLGEKAISVLQDVRKLSTSAKQLNSQDTATVPKPKSTTVPKPVLSKPQPSFSLFPASSTSSQRPASPTRPTSPSKLFERPKSPTKPPIPTNRPASPIKSKIADAIKVFGGGKKTVVPSSPVKSIRMIGTESPAKDISHSTITKLNASNIMFSPSKNTLMMPPGSAIKLNSSMRPLSPVKSIAIMDSQNAINPTNPPKRRGRESNDTDTTTASSIKTTTTTTTTTTSFKVKGSKQQKPVKVTSSNGSLKENNRADDSSAAEEQPVKQTKPRGRVAKTVATKVAPLTEATTTKRVLRSKK